MRAGENEAASGGDRVHLWEVGTCIGDAPRRKLGDFTQGDLPANLTGIEVIRGQSSPGRRNHREAAVCEHKSKAAFVMRRREIGASSIGWRSEEHTSELQSQSNLVCRLLLEKKQD